MRAVNLIPATTPRSDRARAALADAMGAYFVLAVLTGLVVLAGAWAVSHRQLTAVRSDVARVSAAAQVVEAKTALLAPYSAFAAVHDARIETVGGLLDTRVDWSYDLREIGRVVARDAALTSLVATADPSAQVEGGGGGASSRSALPVPAIELVGCSKSQVAVASLLVRLRAMEHVDEVRLASSEKGESSSRNDTECRATDQMPQFDVTISYEGKPALAAAAQTSVPTASPPGAAGAPGGTG
jgi:hypothetical protein